MLRAQSDDRLVVLVRDGREGAFEEIVRRYRTGLLAFAAAYDPPDPEDVVQESLTRSWEALRQSTGEMHVKAWLYTIVRNRALNARRDARFHEPLDESLDGVRQPPEIVLAREELDRAVAAVVALPASQREALVRSSLEGHTHDQIAAEIGSTPGAVRQLIYRARLTVRHSVGAVIPLPVVAALTDASAGGAGVGAAAGGVAATGAAGGASLATKAAMVGAIGVIAAGSGVAIKRSADGEAERRAASTEARESPPAETGSPSSGSAVPAADFESGSGGSSGPDPGTGGDPPAAQDSGHTGSPGGGTGGGDRSGDGSGSSSGDGGGSSGSGASGPGGGSSHAGGGGSSGSGSGESGTGGSGGGDLDGDSPDEQGIEPDEVEPVEEPEELAAPEEDTLDTLDTNGGEPIHSGEGSPTLAS